MATSDWIEWSGGEQPVPNGTMVQVKWADPSRPTREAIPAETWSEFPREWSITDADENPTIQIIAYRVVSA